MSTKNAQRRLEASLRADGPRGQVTGQGKQGKIFLQQLHDGAMNKSQEEMKKRWGGNSKDKGSRMSEEQLVQARLRGASEEDAREIAFQAREQMDALSDVRSRVRNAMDNSKELFEDEDETTAALPPLSPAPPSSRPPGGAVIEMGSVIVHSHVHLHGIYMEGP